MNLIRKTSRRDFSWISFQDFSNFLKIPIWMRRALPGEIVDERSLKKLMQKLLSKHLEGSKKNFLGILEWTPGVIPEETRGRFLARTFVSSWKELQVQFQKKNFWRDPKRNFWRNRKRNTRKNPRWNSQMNVGRISWKFTNTRSWRWMDK